MEEKATKCSRWRSPWQAASRFSAPVPLQAAAACQVSPVCVPQHQSAYQHFATPCALTCIQHDMQKASLHNQVRCHTP